MKRSRLRARNPKRKQSEWQRAYGSKARVAWVKAQPCVVGQHCAGPIENAHTANGGMGRKGDADTIVPLCRRHHALLHRMGVLSFERTQNTGVPLTVIASLVELQWRNHAASSGLTPIGAIVPGVVAALTPEHSEETG